MSEREVVPYEELVTLSTRFRKFIGGDVTKSMQGSNFNRDNVERTKPQSYDKEPYYLMMDESSGYTNNHNLSLSMRRNVHPTLKALIDCCTREREGRHILFTQGMFVEYLSKSMEWKVGVVNRVIKQAPDDWDFKQNEEIPEEEKEIFYNVGVEGLLGRKNVRAPTRGLQYIFGKRPWLWQQFVMMKLEKRLRFDVDHEFDFEEFDCVEFAKSDFDCWLNAEENADFLELYEEQRDITKYLLRDTLLKPFRIMDDLVENQELWDFEDNPNFSVYTYLGVLGSGFPVAVMVFAIQLFAPVVILFNVLFVAGDNLNPRFENVYDGFDIVAANGNFLPATNLEDFCLTQNLRFEGKFLIFIVILVYMSTVVPESFVTFYRVSGQSDTSFSKVTSIMLTIFEQDDANLWQIIGFKLDRIMNAGYVAMLHCIMLFILVQTPAILDIILNALAIDFIYQIDERVAGSSWFDYRKRFLRAGVIELIIRKTLRLDKFKKPAEFCRFFGIAMEDYVSALDGKKPLLNPLVARLDDVNPLYMTRKERVYNIVADKAREGGYRFIYNQYKKKIVEFGFVDKIFRSMGFKHSGMFNRFYGYRTWSRWEKILFLPVLPRKEEEVEAVAAEEDPEKQQKGAPGIEDLAVTVKVGKRDQTEFFAHIVLTVLGIELVSTTALSMWRGNFHLIPIKVAFGILEVIFYIAQLLFPIVMLTALVFAPYCY